MDDERIRANYANGNIASTAGSMVQLVCAHSRLQVLYCFPPARIDSKIVIVPPAQMGFKDPLPEGKRLPKANQKKYRKHGVP